MNDFINNRYVKVWENLSEYQKICLAEETVVWFCYYNFQQVTEEDFKMIWEQISQAELMGLE